MVASMSRVKWGKAARFGYIYQSTKTFEGCNDLQIWIYMEPHYTASRYPGDATDVAPSDIYDDIMAGDVREKAQTILYFVEQERKVWKPTP